MNQPSYGDAIDRLLRADAARPLADDGFNARVLRALPPPALGSWWKPAIILASAAFGGVLAFLLAPAGASLFAGFADLAAARYATPAAYGAIATAIALVLTGVILATDTD